MGGNYEHGLYHQLMEVMERLDAVEKESKKEIRNLKDEISFLHDFKIPFDDNRSERDLRKAKNHQKMAGGFRKSSGHEMYCNILTIIETLKRRKMAIFKNIKLLLTPAIF